jgi:protein ImuA
VSILPSPAGFASVQAAAAAAPLTEFAPAGPGDEAAAAAFLCAWAASAAADGLVVWSAPDAGCAEHGEWCSEGFSQIGLDLARLLVVRAPDQADALWAIEQALEIPGALAACTIAAGRKPLSLTGARRLLLRAQAHRTRALLLRLDGAGASACWTRWRIAAAPSAARDRLIGPPRFFVTLTRNRAGPSGASWLVEWNPHARRFVDCTLAGAASAAPDDRLSAPRRPHAA